MQERHQTGRSGGGDGGERRRGVGVGRARTFDLGMYSVQWFRARISGCGSEGGGCEAGSELWSVQDPRGQSKHQRASTLGATSGRTYLALGGVSLGRLHACQVGVCLLGAHGDGLDLPDDFDHILSRNNGLRHGAPIWPRGGERIEVVRLSEWEASFPAGSPMALNKHRGLQGSRRENQCRSEPAERAHGGVREETRFFFTVFAAAPRSGECSRAQCRVHSECVLMCPDMALMVYSLSLCNSGLSVDLSHIGRYGRSGPPHCVTIPARSHHRTLCPRLWTQSFVAHAQGWCGACRFVW